LKSLDVGGVDDRRLTALSGPKAGFYRLLRATNDPLKNPHHPSSSGVALDDLSDHEALRQKEPGTPSPSGAKRLAQYAQSLLGVGCRPIGAKQKAPKRPTSAHPLKERPNQAAVAAHLHHAAQPQPATNRKCRGQPQDAADHADTQFVGLNMRQEHPSGLDEVFVDPLALPPTFALPAGDSAFVEAESRNYCLNRAAVGQQGHDGCDQLVGLVCPIECSTFGFAESLGASFAAIAPLFWAVYHNVALTRSSVSPATLVVAESFVRVHVRASSC
jgi:nitrous oxide reductase accessory protein NosL